MVEARPEATTEFRFTYNSYHLKAEQHVHYVFTVSGPSGISFQIHGRYSVFEEWYTQFCKAFKESLKRQGQKQPANMPSLPKNSFKDNIAQMQRKESYYQKRGEALAEFFNNLVTI